MESEVLSRGTDYTVLNSFTWYALLSQPQGLGFVFRGGRCFQFEPEIIFLWCMQKLSSKSVLPTLDSASQLVNQGGNRLETGHLVFIWLGMLLTVLLAERADIKCGVMTDVTVDIINTSTSVTPEVF